MRKKTSKAAKIRDYLLTNPNAKASEVATKFDTSPGVFYTLKRKLGLTKTRKQKWSTVAVTTSNAPLLEEKNDPVNHPAHYKTGGIETIDFIEAKQLGYHLGNVVKYITRADHKGAKLQDLNKAKWYLDRAIEKAQS